MSRIRALLITSVIALAACGPGYRGFDPANPARGPGTLVAAKTPAPSSSFTGGNDVVPNARAATPPDGTRPPDCDGDCAAYCSAANLANPVNRGLCRSLWGVGLASRPIDNQEACRRLFVDFKGRLPTHDELTTTCTGDWAATVRTLLDDPAFVRLNQRRTADRFLYSTEVVSVEAIFDMDGLAAKLFRGEVPYDVFAAVASAHPVMTRRNADPSDRAELLFRQFIGRPPFENERADMSRLFTLWHNGYYEHAALGMRLPDAFIRYRCVTPSGEIDPEARGECASVLWGHNELILTPDLRSTWDDRADAAVMWGGLLEGDEWEQLTIPGRILTRGVPFWEHAVDEVLDLYLGYDLAAVVPDVRDELVRYFLDHGGDLRALHFAVATSVAYLQSNRGQSSSTYRWTYGPMKQLDAESWLDSLSALTGFQIAGCDRRITTPDDFLQTVSGYKLLESSEWRFRENRDGEDEIDREYADAARTLGGCPANVISGRFKVTSILTTATQLAAVNRVCNTTLSDLPGAPLERLLPANVAGTGVTTAELAASIADHQYRAFYGRAPTLEETTEAKNAGELCAATQCTAEQFARPFCFALLSGAEMIFY